MTEIAQQEERPGVLAEIRGDAFRQQLAAALPPGITPDRFQRLTITALLDDQIRQRDPAKQLLACERGSLYQAIIKCAQDGLSPDGREAALVKRGDKVAYQPMVLGLRKIAARYGWTIRSAAVREKDEFDYTDEPPSLYHKVFTAGPRGELVFAYAVARHLDGRREQRVMTRDDVLKRADSATTKQIWDSWPDEMWAKTPARDLFQELPLDIAIRERATEDAALEPGDLYGNPELSAAPDQTPAETGAAEELPEEPTSAAPPPTLDDEPGPSEPAGEQAERDAINAAAETAAGFVPLNGKYGPAGQFGPKTLQEILELGEDGANWFTWALGKIKEPAEYRDAIWSYSRVFAPKLWQEAAARKELA